MYMGIACGTPPFARAAAIATDWALMCGGKYGMADEPPALSLPPPALAAASSATPCIAAVGAGGITRPPAPARC